MRKNTKTVLIILSLSVFMAWHVLTLAQDTPLSTEPRTRALPTPTPKVAIFEDLREPDVSGRYALLIGIQDYAFHPDIPSLQGPLNDLSIVEHMLREHFGFQDGNIQILRDSEATHTGIAQAFRTLIDAVGTNDFVYIYYSGHGSQTPDLNGDEADGYDETWVSYGARQSAGDDPDNYDILDDEVNSWLSELSANTHNMVLVSDSCHSATVSRGESVISRGVSADKRHHPLGTLDYRQPASYPGVRVGAARDQESAIEITMQDNRHYGLFTWYWVEALQQSQPGETWYNIFKRAYTRVTAGRGNVQRPQFEGPRTLQLEGFFSPPSSTVAVTNVEDDLVTIRAGYLAGVTPGSVYRIHVPNHPDPQSLTIVTITRVTITRVKTFTSIGYADGPVEAGDLVTEESHVYTFLPFRVHVAADYAETLDRGLLQALRNAFSSSSERFPAYALTDDAQQAELHLYILHPKQEDGQYLRQPDDILPTSFPDQAPEVWVLSPEHRLLYDNLRIAFDDVERGMQVLQKNLTRLARIRELKALDSPRNTQIDMNVEVHHFSPVAICRGEEDCRALPNDLGFFRIHAPFPFPDLEGRTYHAGDILSFTLHNASRYDYYCYLLDIAPDGTISAIFPDPDASVEHARVNPGTGRELIEEVGLLADITGEETLKFIASRQPIDVTLLESSRFELRGGHKGTYNPLEQLLVNVMYGQRSVVRYNIDEWATQQVSFEVVAGDD